MRLHDMEQVGMGLTDVRQNGMKQIGMEQIGMEQTESRQNGMKKSGMRQNGMGQSGIRRKLAAAGLAGAMAAALLAGPAAAEEAGGADPAVEEETALTEETPHEEALTEETPHEEALTEETPHEEASTEETRKAVKDETVYVIADAAGKAQNVIVSDWIKNTSQSDLVTDVSTLTGIENLEGGETFEEKDGGVLEWSTGGSDLYYQGTTDEELPVTVTATYMLDGKEMSPEEMAGRSGEVTIRYEYKNSQKEEVELDGIKSTLHVPFAVITGTLLDEDSLRDVEVTNGRLISDGDLTIVAGIAFPGIAEDLETPAYAALTKLVEADVPDFLEIRGTTDDFHWNTTYTMVTNELFTASEKDISVTVGEIFGKLDSLKDGIGQISDGVTSLNDGAGELRDGTQALADGLASLTENNEALLDGAEQICDSALETVKEQLEASGITLEELTMDNYGSVLGLLEKMAQGESREKLSGAIAQLDGLKEFRDGLAAYTGGVAEAGEGAARVNDGAASLQAGTSRLLLGTAILRSALPDLSGVPEALKSSVSLGEEYDSFSGLADDMEGKVRFIWKLGEIA